VFSPAISHCCGTAMPFWYIASLLLLVSATVGHLHQPGVMLLGAATGVWAAVILLSLLFLVPNRPDALIERGS
jgi:hypothetical protein